ncbi:MAG: tetratricopeptide repeat protein [Alphaproteobacteria bacterium]|nr:tetratricopeptide repeat protein [Alphaproteobacteria bacterium]
MSDIFREIDEEIRRENLLQLWSRYGRYIIAAVVLALLAAGAVVAWRDHQRSERESQSTRFAGALALTQQDKDSDAAKAFAAIAQEGGGYGTLAAFEEADLLGKSGDAKAAVAAYDRLAGSGSLDPELRDLAVLLSVMREPADTDPKTTVDRLAPLTAAGNPWRPSALELTAAAKLKAGDRAAALDLYKSIADDVTTPQGLRARAAEMSAALTP